MSLDWMNAPVTQGFGPTSTTLDGPYGGTAHFNKGIDFGVGVGTPIGIPVGGEVIAAGDQGDGWGLSVKIRDANGNIHNYGHLSEVNVGVGAQVGPGTVIGKSGNTGKSTGPHLSYDVHDGSGNYFDPSGFLSGDMGGQEESWQSQAAEQFDVLLEELAANPPDPNDPRYDIESDQFEGTYQDAIDAWTSNVLNVANASQQLKLSAYGLTKLPDGTVVAVGDLTPEEAKAIDDANYNRYAEVMNSLGLAEYDVRREREIDIENTKKTNFDLKLDELEAGLSYDDLNLERAGMDINRSLAGLQESRERAKYVGDMIHQWGLPAGKTSISLLDVAPGLLKAAGSKINPADIQINYPGTFSVDKLMEDYDKALGVGGPLPQVPSLVTNPANIPKAPTLIPPSTPLPTLLTPRPPAPVQQQRPTERSLVQPVVGPGGVILPKGVRSYIP